MTLKSIPSFSLIGRAAIVLGLIGLSSAHGQEENLERALRDQDRRMAGLTALANQIRGFMTSVLPEGWIDDPEKEIPAVPESAAKVAVREVKLIDGESVTSGKASDAIAAAAEQAELEADAYLANMQKAATKLNITGSFPQRKEIMIGAKNLGIGEAIAVQLQQHMYDFEILDITKSELKLRDQKTQLELSVAIGVTQDLPPGMSRSAPPMTFFENSGPSAAGSGSPAVRSGGE